MLKHRMPFLAHARNRASFLRRLAQIHPVDSAAFAPIEKMCAQTEELFSENNPLLVRCWTTGLIATERLGMRSINSIVAAIGQRNRKYAHDQGLTTWDTDYVMREFGYDVEISMHYLSPPPPYIGMMVEGFHECFVHIRKCDLLRSRLSLVMADLLYIDEMSKEEASVLLREINRYYIPAAARTQILERDLKDAFGEALGRKLFA